MFLVVLPFNPLEAVKRIKNSPDLSRTLPDRVQDLRRQVHSDPLNVRDRAIVELLCTGMTVRELCSLGWEGQGNTEERCLPVAGRRVELHRKAHEALQHYLILRPILLGSSLIVGGRHSGYALTPATVYGLLKRLSLRIGATVKVCDLRLARFIGITNEANTDEISAAA